MARVVSTNAIEVIKNAKALKKALKAIPRKFVTRELKKIVRAGATPVVKAARKLVPVGDGLDPRGNKRLHLKESLDKKIVGRPSKGTAAAIIGHKSNKAQHAHLVHDGTEPHIIKVGFKTDGRGNITESVDPKTGLPRKTLADDRKGIIFGRKVQHPGTVATKYLLKAQRRSTSKVHGAMSKKASQLINKIATQESIKQTGTFTT